MIIDRLSQASDWQWIENFGGDGYHWTDYERSGKDASLEMRAGRNRSVHFYFYGGY